MTATASLAVAQGNEYLQGWAANERPAHLQEPCLCFVMVCHALSYSLKRCSFFKCKKLSGSAQELFICGHTTPDRNEAVILAQALHPGAPGCSIVAVYTLDSLQYSR